MADEAGAIELSETYVHIEGGAATPFAVSPTFWQEVISGRPTSPGATRALGGGWLMTGQRSTQSSAQWERHPAGDEVLMLVSGHMGIALARGQGVEIVELDQPGATCVVPRGVWHRQLVRAPSHLVALTFGEGTEHRPVGPRGGKGE